MSLKLTAASFLAGVKQSGLIDAKRFDALLAELQRSGVDLSDSAAIAQSFVARKILTDWQCEKLLQGRHKGFILGRYRLLSLLGTGEMSAVYLAEHIMMERRCAIKVLPANKVQDTSYLGRFHREARAVASLNHPNIVKAFDVDKQNEGGAEIHFLVMEYVSGKNLGKTVLEKGPLDFIQAVDYIRQGADGLQHAHEAGLVHRDIKPENLLIDQEGVVKLLDLGLARFFNASDEESLTIKHDEKVLGTADFLAPEQAIDSHKVDLRADIYSLGCTLYYGLTGHPPFTDGSLVQRLLAHQTRRPPSIRYDRPDIAEDLLAIIDKMMAKKPGERYQTAADVADVLGRWLVQHGGATWRETHPALVAKFAGLEAVTRPQPPAPVVTNPPVAAAEKATPKFESPQLDLTAETAKIAAKQALAIEVDTPEPERPRPESPLPKPARDSVKAQARSTTDSARRTVSLRSSQPVAVVSPREKWDWEKTLAIGLLTLGTVIVIMLGVWLFGANQNTTTANTETVNSTTPQTSERSGNEGPQ